jgi:hypothetical protein
VLSASAEEPAARQSVPDSRPWVAVLPFRNAGDYPDETYFAHGIVEDVIVSLTGLRELAVISRSSSVALTERGADIREIGPMPMTRRRWSCSRFRTRSFAASWPVLPPIFRTKSCAGRCGDGPRT